MPKRVSVLELIDELNLECVHYANSDRYVFTADINRPGMQFMGYYEHFPFNRIQVVGNAEYSYITALSSVERKEILNQFLSYDLPLVCVTRGRDIPDDLIDLADQHDIFLVATELPTTRFVSKLSDYVNDRTAPLKVIHGGLVDVDGLGILIMGESGLGKSEAALELVQRGHRLVADDAVEIKMLEDGILVGQSPELTRHIIEIRGVGILDVKSLYGVGAVKPSKTIDLVITLEKWNESSYYDRLGIEDDYTNILGVSVPHLTIPIRPGRNISVIIEIAARNQRQKYMGYNAAKALNERLISKLRESSH